MTDGMVERVLRALHDREARVLENGLAPFDRQPTSYQDVMRDRARAAIEAHDAALAEDAREMSAAQESNRP